jgi:hypothetical protein
MPVPADRRRLPARLAAIALVGVAAACAPQTGAPSAAAEAPAESSAEGIYLELHKAIAAYQRCRDAEFTQQQRQALETRVQRMAGHPLGAGTMLRLIERAKDDMARRIATAGCSSPAVAPRVHRFESDLAGAAGL